LSRKAFDDVLLPFFEEKVLVTHGVFSTREKCQKVLDLLPGDELWNKVKEALAAKWEEVRWFFFFLMCFLIDRFQERDSSPERKWSQFKATAEEQMQKQREKKAGKFLPNPIHIVVFYFTYPRLDVNVSKSASSLHLSSLLSRRWI
jgi:UDP-2,3-diacylglucosamine pyrophosphatase LpxH